MTAYKIVHKHRDLIVSFTLAGKQVIYKLGSSVKRPENCGPLACFNTLENALEYRGIRKYSIFKCEIIKSKDKGLWVPTDVAEILRNDITFAPQIENYIIHGAIKNICDLFDKLVEAREAKLRELAKEMEKEIK